MKQIRRNVFETNSSSSHSVTVQHIGHAESELKVEADGYVHAEFGEFGWEVCDYEDQETRLSYLLTMARELTGCHESYWDDGSFEEDMENFQNTHEFEEIEEAIREHTGSLGLRIDKSDGYIDHQSRTDYNTLSDFLSYYDTDIEEFIFGAGVVLHTDNDNHC